MGDNEKQMTLEERITQKLKSDTLMSLVGDEDAITELVKRAIREALFKDRTSGSGYTQTTIPSPIVQAATEVARELAKKVGATLLADAEVNAKVLEAFAAALPLAVMNAMQSGLSLQIFNQASEAAANALRNSVR